MSRRQRFLNPKAAGARAAYDARYITGVADNTALSTWNDIAGSNTLTQSGGARPLYRSLGYNNFPVVRFDGTDDQIVSAGSFGSNNVISGNPAISFVVTYYKYNNTTKGNVFGWGAVSPTAGGCCGIYDDGSIRAVAFAGGNNFNFTAAAADTWYVFRYKKPAGNINTGDSSRNGVNVNVSSSSITPNINGGSSLVIGNWANYGVANFFQGDVASLCIANVEWNTSLSKRIEQAAATSFKIAYG